MTHLSPAFEFSWWALPFFGQFIISLLLAGLLWEYRRTRGAVGLFVYSLCLAGIGLILLRQVTVPDGQAKAFWWRLLPLLTMPAALSWTYMAVEFSDNLHLITPRRVAISLLAGLAILASIWLPWTAEYYLVDWTVTNGTLQVTVGPLLWVYWIGYVGGHIGLGTFLLTRLFYTQEGFSGPVLVLVASILFVFGVSTLYSLQVSPVEMGGIGALLQAILVIAGVAWFGILDVTPVARETLVENMDDAVLVLDDHGVIRDANPAATSLLQDESSREDGLVGRSIAKTVPEVTRLFERRQEMIRLDSTDTAGARTDGGDHLVKPPDEAIESTAHPQGVKGDPIRDEIRLDRDGQTRFVTAVLTPLQVRETDETGTLLVFRDSTDRHRKERQLQEKNEQLAERNEELARANDRLQQFGAILSGDVRTQIELARAGLERAVEAGDHEALDDVDAGFRTTEAIIEEVLSLLRIEAKASEVRTVRLDECVETAFEHVPVEGARPRCEAGQRIDADREYLLVLLKTIFRYFLTCEKSIETIDVVVAEGTLTIEGRSSGEQNRVAKVAASGLQSNDLREVPTDGGPLAVMLAFRIASAHGWTLVTYQPSDSPDRVVRFEFDGV